jgi:hypothetical protein
VASRASRDDGRSSTFAGLRRSAGHRILISVAAMANMKIEGDDDQS